MQPITPYQAFNNAGRNIPAEVIDVVNEFLLEKLRVTENSREVILTARLTKDDVMERIRQKVGECKTEWLDFEPLFRKAGWEVHYDRPGYNESYHGYYSFQARHPR